MSCFGPNVPKSVNGYYTMGFVWANNSMGLIGLLLQQYETGRKAEKVLDVALKVWGKLEQAQNQKEPSKEQPSTSEPPLE